MLYHMYIYIYVCMYVYIYYFYLYILDILGIITPHYIRSVVNTIFHHISYDVIYVHIISLYLCVCAISHDSTISLYVFLAPLHGCVCVRLGMGEQKLVNCISNVASMSLVRS